MNDPTLGTLVQRLERLERENRRVKLLAIGLAIGIAALVLMGQVPATRGTKVIEAERFVLLDTNGRTRAILGAGPQGYALAFYDANGKGRLVVGVDAAGPNLGLLDANEMLRILLGITLKGWPVLGLLDANGKTRAELAIEAQGPSLSLFDAANKIVRAKLAMGGMEPSLFFTYADEKPSVALNGGGLAFVDRSGKFRTMLSMAPDGTPRLFFADKNGSPIWMAP